MVPLLLPSCVSTSQPHETLPGLKISFLDFIVVSFVSPRDLLGNIKLVTKEKNSAFLSIQ